MRTFAVSEAHYIHNNTHFPIAGVPGYNEEFFGEYTGKYPYEAASKAFTGLQKHMKKFYKTGDWFPHYDPEQPPVIIYKLVEMDTDNDVVLMYRGERTPAHQGDRTVVNKSDGRIRHYRWDNNITKYNP